MLRDRNQIDAMTASANEMRNKCEALMNKQIKYEKELNAKSEKVYMSHVYKFRVERVTL